MRLLQIKEGGNFSLVEHVRDIPDYAILSHTWGADEDEVTFRDLVDGTGKTKAGYRKIHFCGKQAAKDKLDYFWVDTCCIDKSSSAELSEAINSMFRWYYNAAKCYVYLSDVSIGDSVGNDPSFQHSRWFTRGWTLQELIAPTCVEFFSVECERLGDKGSMVQEIHEITGISVRALQGSPLPQLGVGERMSWAERRETKREEDAAYSLLGIFDVHMPLIYGEGKRKAFERLKKEINQLLWDESSALPSSLYLKNEESSPTPSSSIPFRREPGFMDRGTPLDQIRKKDSVAESLVSIHAQSRPSESSFPEFFQKKKWDHEFLQDRGPNEQESYAEFMRSYAKSLGLNPPVNHVTSILQEYEDTSIPACEVDEIATFCKGVRLRDLTMHNPNQRKGAWIDDRMYSSYHPGQITQGNRSASSELDHAFGTASIEEPLLELVSQPLGASKGTALSSARHHLPFREYGGFQTAAALFGHLKQKRFGHAEMPNADRRLIYIQDLSPEYALALLETATWHQIPVLTDALWKHLALQTSMRINVPPRGYKIFQLDFHMPFYALRAGWPKDSYQNGTLVKPPRSWFDMTFLASGKQKPVKETVWGIHEAQISFVICGPAERRWTAYAFVDTDFDTDFDEDEMSGYDFDYSSIIEDPIAPDGDLNANHPIWNPREYYLVIVRARLGKVLSEWKQLVRMIEMGVREYTHIHPSLSKAIEAKESVIENLEWTLRTLHILRTLIGCLSKTNDIWYRFAGFDGDIAYLSDLGSASCKSREYIQGYLREIKEIFQELGNLERRLSDLEQQCNTSKEILQLRLTVESNNTTQLGKYTSESVLSMFRNILGGVGGSERQRN